MAFIDELIEKGGLPYGMEVEQPKAHDKINSLIVDNDIESIIQGLIMDLVGGGKGKGIKKLALALKGKIKGGKMIPSQPIRRGSIGVKSSANEGAELYQQMARAHTQNIARQIPKFDMPVSAQVARRQPSKGLPPELIALLSGGAGAGGAAYGMENLQNNPLINFLAELMMPDPDMSDAGRMYSPSRKPSMIMSSKQRTLPYKPVYKDEIDMENRYLKLMEEVQKLNK